jgi:hypothetical protein
LDKNATSRQAFDPQKSRKPGKMIPLADGLQNQSLPMRTISVGNARIGEPLAQMPKHVGSLAMPFELRKVIVAFTFNSLKRIISVMPAVMSPPANSTRGVDTALLSAARVPR